MSADPPAHWPHRLRSRLCEVGGLRWHFQHWRPEAAEAAAPGRPLALLLHGTGASAHSWRLLAPLLAARCDVLAPDLPGHGFTLTPAHQDLSLPGVVRSLQALLSHLGVEPDLLIGHSAGAAMACRLVLYRPGAVRAVVAVNGALLPLHGVAGQWFGPMARLLAANPLVAPAFSRWAAGPRLTQRLLAGTGSQIDDAGRHCYEALMTTPRHIAGALRLMAAWDLHALQLELPRLPVPLHLVVGSHDRTLSPAHADRIRQQLPTAVVHRLEGLGHLAHEEDAAAVAAICEQAGAGHDPGGHEYAIGAGGEVASAPSAAMPVHRAASA